MGYLRGGRNRLRPRRCPPRSPPFRPFRAVYDFMLVPAQPAQPAMAIQPPPPVRQNYHPQCEDAVNHHINLELHASFVYLAMSYYFDQNDVALENFAQLFLRQSQKKKELAKQLMKLQNLRGGRLRLRDIRKPDSDDWESGLKALECAFQLEKTLNQSLLALHQVATEKKDPHLCSFLESNFLHDQVKAIQQLSDYITSLRKMGAPDSSLADYLFDKLTLGNSDKN